MQKYSYLNLTYQQAEFIKRSLDLEAMIANPNGEWWFAGKTLSNLEKKGVIQKSGTHYTRTVWSWTPKWKLIIRNDRENLLKYLNALTNIEAKGNYISNFDRLRGWEKRERDLLSVFAQNITLPASMIANASGTNIDANAYVGNINTLTRNSYVVYSNNFYALNLGAVNLEKLKEKLIKLDH